MSLTDFSLKHPYTVLAVSLAIAAMGIFAMFRTPTDLFPESAPPQVLVVTIRPGAAARDIADKLTEVIEKELNGISGIKKVSSTSRDEVSSISAEFLYYKPIGEAVQDVQNAIARVRTDLPDDILEPRLYQITEATRPLVTLALSPKSSTRKSLSEVRLLAENDIADTIRTLPGIADVEVMGAHQAEVKIRVHRDRLAAHGFGLHEVLQVVGNQNVSAPAGIIYSEQREYLIKTVGEFADLRDIRNLPIKRTGPGYIRLADVAEVTLEEQEPRSLYHGNGKRAIALNVLRPDKQPTVPAIKAIKTALSELEMQYPDIRFEITDDQQPLIDINVQGMRTSLMQAIILTVVVIFVFLADSRAAMVVSISIPIAFLTTLVVLWFSPYTLNMVTLSGLIVAVGMVVDAAVVVLENIYRHYKDMREPNAEAAARNGSSEVAIAITAGMLTTVIVLIPVMFTGGYTQQVMRPLNMMIVSTLIASLVAALTLIPLLASRLLARPRSRKNKLERWFGNTDHAVERLAQFYMGILRKSLRHKAITLAVVAVLFVLTIRLVVPLIGNELMPPMDTGITIIEFDTPSGSNLRQVEQVLNNIEALVYGQPGVRMVSSVIGSEAGQVSFGGGGGTAQSGKLTVHLVDRKQRSETIWDIQNSWRAGLEKIPGIQSFRVSEFGATPLSTTRAPLDVIVSGPESRILNVLADRVLDALEGLPGLIDVRRSWYFDKEEREVTLDPDLARLYGTSPAEAASQLLIAVKGVSAGDMRLEGFLDIPIRVQYAGPDIDDPEDVGDIYLASGFGPMPLRSMAEVDTFLDQPSITREQLRNTINITGVNRLYTIGQVAEMVEVRLEGIALPEGYRVEVAGSAIDMRENKSRMGKALVLGLVLLYMLLLAIFKSFRHPVTIMLAIPLAVAGALWGLLLFDKPLCMPAIMGFILLGGTVVNNSILLLDFVETARARGVGREEAIFEAVRLRLRPILMTTVSTVVGLSPLVFESAVGLERMSPLGIVAATGLIVGTFLTMVVVPVVYSAMDELSQFITVRLKSFRLASSTVGKWSMVSRGK